MSLRAFFFKGRNDVRLIAATHRKRWEEFAECSFWQWFAFHFLNHRQYISFPENLRRSRRATAWSPMSLQGSGPALPVCHGCPDLQKLPDEFCKVISNIQLQGLKLPVSNLPDIKPIQS